MDESASLMKQAVIVDCVQGGESEAEAVGPTNDARKRSVSVAKLADVVAHEVVHLTG